MKLFIFLKSIVFINEVKKVRTSQLCYISNVEKHT